MTQFIAIMPVLRVTDLQRSIEWYAEVLGFHVKGQNIDDGGNEYCFVTAGDTEVLLSTGLHLGGRQRSPAHFISESKVSMLYSPSCRAKLN